ncbi:MAG TPA: PIN domain-containing protein [Pyrinomonadaceae bacterium]|nr:PIN domain-containing protein [Pyrinomonadaceae bacterium]
MTPLFIDAGYLIALEASDDQHHDDAVRHWRGLLRSLPPLVTTSYVFGEVVTFFNSRNRHAKAVEVGESLLGSPSVEFIHVDEQLFLEGWQLLRRHRDKSYSLTDCVSFILMGRRGMREALTFDRHFAQAGFDRLP